MTTVLVVDDERSIREVLAAFLRDEGYTVHTAIDGRRALDTLQHIRPTVVLTDLMMPELDGVELARTIRQQPETATMPIILMSSAERPAGAATLFSAFLPKPFDLEHLLQTVARFSPCSR